ncbi:MAG: ATP-binding protein [Gemmatales bacterium]|nr:MAG: ATP-binding protein [Gemmatales bacterium]
MSDVRKFGAKGDGETDDTNAILHTVKNGDGYLHFPRGVYLISKTIDISLDRVGPVSIDGNGGTAKIVMAGKGPAFRLVGTHTGTGDPNSVKPNVFQSQRFPTISNIEIEGRHPHADGIESFQTMQAVFERVLIHHVRHGIRLYRRNRNVIISQCHIYFNTGAGIFMDRLNLHQINIVGNHISYNRLGGIRIEASEIRNLQITGNDIEYNNHRAHKTEPEPTAEIYIDTTGEGSSVEEITVASNTIQATPSSGGANIRIKEKAGNGRPPGLWSISGNIIGNQENNVHLTGCHGVVVSGNFIYSCDQRNVLLENCSQINLTGNSFRRHGPNLRTGVRLVDSSDCVITGCTVQDETAEGQTTKASLLELVRCERINVLGCQFLDGVPFGIDASDCSYINVTGCTILDTRTTKKTRAAVRFAGAGKANLLSSNIIGDAVQIAKEANVTMANNVTL